MYLFWYAYPLQVCIHWLDECIQSDRVCIRWERVTLINKLTICDFGPILFYGLDCISQDTNHIIRT